MIIELIKAEDFEQVMAEGTWIVCFCTTYCGPCRAMDIVINKFIDENPMVNFAHCNLDHAPDYRQRFNVEGVPDLMFVNDGKITDRSLGLISMEMLEEKVAHCMYG